MKNKIIGIIILMLVATTMVSATNINMHQGANTIVGYQPTLFDWWCVDQKNTEHSGYGFTLFPPEKSAQSFTPTKDKLTAVSLYLFKYGAPPDPDEITIVIRDNLTGQDLATKTIDTNTVTIDSKGTWILFDFDDITITPESTYYIICTGTVGDASNAYCWLYANNDTYTRGEAWYKPSDVLAWRKWPSGSTNPADFCFKTYFRKPLDVPASTSTNKMQTLTYGVDAPVWEVGDSWIYNYQRAEYRYNGSTLWYTMFLNESYTDTVVDDTGENYIINSISKDTDGGTTITSYRLKYTALTKVITETILRKTDFALIQQGWDIKGLVFWLLGSIGLPFPAQYLLSATITTTPGNVQLPFPLTAGASGTLPGYSWTMQEKVVLYWGLITLFDHPDGAGTAGSTPYHCEMETITVPAGTFTAYNVSVDVPIGLYGHYSFWQYYVPEVGNVVKFYVNQTTSWGAQVYLIESELVDFNYTP